MPAQTAYSSTQISPAGLARLRADNPDFDRDQALIRAIARDCAIAYMWSPYVDPQGFTYTGWSTVLYAGVEEQERTAYVMFRGTDQLIDWVINLFCPPLLFAKPLGHAGFLLTWAIARRRLTPWLRAQAGRYDRIVVGGHSLGGALALACAYDLQRDGLVMDRCITVGAPRVYTTRSAQVVADALHGRAIRVCREQDVVPKVPPEWLGYRHVGQCWQFVSELAGERVATPFEDALDRFGHIWWILSGGSIGDWLEKNGMAPQMRTQLLTLLLGGVAGLGAWAALAVNVSVGLFYALSMGLLVASAAVLALKAHGSGHYAASRRAQSLIEEWQVQEMRRIAAGQTLEPASEGHSWVNVSTTVRAGATDAQKARLIRAVRKRFKRDPFATPIGASLKAAVLGSSAAQAFGMKRSRPRPTLDQEFTLAALSLSLYGYTPEEVDAVLDTGTIGRPLKWSRYYAPAPVPAAVPAPAALPDTAGAPAGG